MRCTRRKLEHNPSAIKPSPARKMGILELPLRTWMSAYETMDGVLAAEK